MNLANRPPLGPKQPKPKANPAHLAAVRGLPCAGCGAPPPNESHHCRDRPDLNEQGLYERVPGAAMKSGDRDAIPLCPDCHRMFHLERPVFHALYGRDYTYIGPTRAAIDHHEIDF